jgi:hypothetical protein
VVPSCQKNQTSICWRNLYQAAQKIELVISCQSRN